METQPGDRPDNTSDVPVAPNQEDPETKHRRRQQRLDIATLAGAALTAQAQLGSPK